ncbi:DUF4369 domain-containing protein [Bacteroides sp. 51]|uniref:DUF4369 domain-containing protein n=1 Tax=Bacteroides sp. 51 TaxID=2302938 RepID=UPI0013D6FE11|nr:DUF4369 domain-containing protein [Bacteroides sp. 51]NDV83486.1 DUF4369 domain-containing protein [Bacteroides sp. 51]
MNKLLPFLCSLFVLTSCGKQYKIEGSSAINRLDGKMLFIKTLQHDGEWAIVDSAEIIHGMFTMKGKVDSVVFASLFMNDDNVMPLVVESGNIKVSIGYDNVKASGTPLNDALYEFIGKKSDFDMKIEELESKEARMVLDGVGLKDIYEEINKEGEALTKASGEYVKKFISNNYETILGPNVFVMLCSSLPYPVITPQIEEILKDAPYTFKSHRLVKEFTNKAKENMQLFEEHQRMQENQAAEQGAPVKNRR